MEARKMGLQELISLRRAHPSLNQGNMHEIYKDWSIYAFLRHIPGETMLVLLNNAGTEEFVAVPVPPDFRSKSLQQVYGGAVIRTEGDSWFIRIPANSMSLWEVDIKDGWRLPTWVEFTDRLSRDFQVTHLHYLDPKGEVDQLQLAGDFNNWRARDYPFERSGDSILVQLPLKPGRYEYKLVLNGDQWIADPAAGDFVMDPYGGRNSILTVQAPNTAE